MSLLFSLLAASAYAVGGVFMRKAEGFAHALPTAMVFLCFGVGAALQTLAMRRSEVTVNYILVLGLEAALALLLGVAWLGESVSLLRLAGVALIVTGVVSLKLEEGRGASSGGPRLPDRGAEVGPGGGVRAASK